MPSVSVIHNHESAQISTIYFMCGWGNVVKAVSERGGTQPFFGFFEFWLRG